MYVYIYIYMFFNFLKFIHFWEREPKQGRGREREGGKESEAGSKLWAVSTEPDVGLELESHEIVTWANVGHLTDWAAQDPQPQYIF